MSDELINKVNEVKLKHRSGSLFYPWEVVAVTLAYRPDSKPLVQR